MKIIIEKEYGRPEKFDNDLKIVRIEVSEKDWEEKFTVKEMIIKAIEEGLR